MMLWSRIRSWLGATLRRSRMESEMDAELRFHLEAYAEDLIRSGVACDEAMRRARIEFGGIERVKEEGREARGVVFLESMMGDIHYALRMMRRAPGFTAVAVLSLALGIGANTAIFSLINTLMLRRLPVREPGQLVELLSRYPGEPRTNCCGGKVYEHIRDTDHVFSGLIGAADSRFNVRAEGLEPETVSGDFVVGDFFQVLGMKPAIGRFIGPENDRAGSADSAVAVVSWSYWKNRFHLDPAIPGKRIFVEDVPFTIVGVTPRPFSGLQTGFKPDIWIPVAAEPLIVHPSRLASGGIGFALMGRLKPGASIGQARAEMNVLNEWRVEEISKAMKDPLWRQAKLEVEPAAVGFSVLREQFVNPLLLLMAVVGLLLLLACINVAGMLLARGASRQREMEVRVSLGAGRIRLLRQVLTESLLLSAVGGLLGILLAYFGANALVRIMASGRRIVGLPSGIEIQTEIDWHVLLFTAAVALFTGVLFGLAPAWNAFACAPATSLRAMKGAGETRLRRLFGKSLVAGQVALSVVLLSVAALFLRNLSNLEHLDLGFHRDHVLLVTLDAGKSCYDGEHLSRAYQELVASFESIPGVRSATFSGNTPISGAGASSFVKVEGHSEKPEDRRYVTINWVAPKYFETLGTPLLVGRDFSFRDQSGPRVAIINQAMARYYFPGGDPIGKHFTIDHDWKGFGDGMPFEIVGVVGDAKYYEIREDAHRMIYLSAFQDGNVSSKFALRTSLEPTAIAGEVRRVVGESLRTVRVERLTTLEEQVDASIVPERVIAALSGVLGAFGALLAAIGLYGLLAYTVARRTNEIGVRMALGASPGDVARMVLGDALGMVFAGLVIGAPLAFWGKSIAASLMEDLPVESTVPIVLGAAAMIAVALVATYVPARRAARVDPMVALRYE